MIDFGIYFTYFLVIAAAIAAIVMPLINALSDPKSLMGAGIGIGALLVLFLIGYGLSGSEELQLGDVYADSSTSKLSGGSLIMTYLLGLLAIGGIIYGEVTRMIK